MGNGSALGRWPEVLAWIGQDNLPVRALLQEGRPVSLQDGVLTVEFDRKFDFHRGMIGSPANRELLQRACLEVLGVAVVAVVASSTPVPAEPENGAGKVEAEGTTSALSQALAVFPGSRVTKLGTGEKR
jgi:hypothetical protein